MIGIRVEAENIQTEKIKHCNSSYFTMVAKSEGKSTPVPIFSHERCIVVISTASQKFP
jgi:acyl-CoA hydrolase